MHARRNKSFNEFLRDAVRNNDAEGLKKALSDLNGKERAFVLCRPIFEEKPLLHYSLHEAKGGISNVEAVQEIVNFSTADTLNVPDHEGNYPHTLALEAGKEYAQILLNSRDVDWGISVDNEGNTPFAFAVKNIQFDGNSEIFAQILTKYPDAFDRVNGQGENILHIACESDDAELLRFCIEKSISQSKDLRLLLEQKNGLGETPLHNAYAIQDNSETSDVLKRYIKEGSGRVNVDLSLKNLEKNSVVHTALKVGNRHILDVCKGDFKSEVEGVISLLEYSDIDLLNNYLDSFSPERKDKLIKHSVKELLDHPQRLIRILALEDEDISNKLIEDGQWRQYLAERAPEYMACWLLSGSDRVDELIPGRLPMGRRVSNITGNEEPCQSDAIRSIVSSAIRISGGDKDALDTLFNSRKLPRSLTLEARQVLGLINEKTQADALELILDKSSCVALEEACFKLAEKDRNGTSIIEKICDSCPSDKIDSLLTSAVRNDIHPGANIPFHGRTALKTEMSHVGIKHAREGNYAKVEGIVKALPHVLYAVDQVTDKSILEVAADAGHTPVVRLLIDQHKKVLERDINQDPIHQSCNAISSIEEVSKVSAKDAAHMVSEYLSSNGYISHGDAKRILSNSHPTDRSLLIQSLEAIYPEISTLSFLKYHSPSEKSTTAAEKYKQPSIPQQIGEKKSLTSGVTGSTTKALKDFGSLQHLASSIKNTANDAHEFKEKVLDSLNNERDFRKTSHKSGLGHNVFTLAAILGTPEQYDALLKRYSDKCSFWTKHPGYSASSHGTSLQCAVKAGNSSMARHLLEKCDAEEISIQKGYDKENLIHTIVGSPNLDLLRVLPSASSPKKSSVHSKSVLKALLEKNAHNQTPIDLALTSGEQHTSALLSFISSSLRDSEIERLIGSENIVQTAIERGNTQLLGWIFDTENRHNSSVLAVGKKKGKASPKQLQVLGNRNYELSLLRDACKSQNPDIAPFLLRKINERIQSSSVDEEASANISKLSKQALAYLVANNTYHPEVYSNLMELSQAQDPIKNEFFLKGAWQHDNENLIKHIPYQDIAQHLDKSALIKSGKDNLLLHCLENSTPAELENIDQDLKKALAQSQGKMKKSRDFYAAWCADAELPAVLSEATLHSAILSGDLNRVKDLIAMDPTLIAKSQAGTAETGGDSNLLPYDFAVKKCANSKKHSELTKYLAKQSIDFALSEATAARGIAGVRTDELITQEDWENFSHTVTRILATQGSALELDSMQLANLDGHLRDSASKLFEQSDESPSILRASLSSPKNYRVTSALLRHYLLHHDQLCQQQDPAEVEKIERQVANEINRVEDGHSLLHLAAMHGSYDTLEALLTLGGDKNILTSNGQNIAHLTARSGMLTPTDGEFVFEKLIRENPELNTKDKVGKGLLSYAASCVHPERTVAMLERIIASVPGDTEDRSADGVVLDANLAKYAKNSKKRNKFIKNELNRIDKNRSDNVLDDFLDEYFRDDSTTAAEHALSQLRKITSSSRKNNKKQLPHALERTSERSFTEINPIAGAVHYMSKDRHLLLEKQKKLFSICSQEALSGQDRDMLRCVPMEAFTSRNPDYGFSPLDAAIERENIPFIKEILEYRAEELPPNITNQNGDNIVIQLGKMLENPGVLRDKEFLELYKNLLDKSGCSTRSDSGIKAQYVLRNIGGVSGAELRNIADRAERREVEIGEKFSDAINKVMEEASPNAVQHLSTLTRVYPNHARNAANPFAALLSNILLDKNTETNGISDNARRAIAAFLRDNTLRDTLKNVDAQGNNPLQSALKALVAEVGSPEIGQQRATALLEVCSDVASSLEKKHKDLLEEVFLKHKNYEGENFIESLTDVSSSFDIFRTLETKLTPEKISEHSDLNTILARSANQASLQNHICKNYSVFPIGDSDYRGKSRIHKAAVSGDHDAFMSVMVTGGNINLLDQDGNTPLHALLIHMLRNRDSNNIKPGHIETLKTLVSHGAPLHLKNKEGFSVCDLAKSIERLPSPVKRSMFSFRRKKEDSCVDLVAQAHLQYHDLKEDVKKKVESNITWPSDIEKSTLSFCDLSGSKVAVKIGTGGVLTSSKLLQSKVFKENALSSANFDFGDGKDLGSVEKVGNKRNYTVQKGTIKLELSWKPSEGKTQKVQVDVLADGTVKVNDESIRECGAQGEKLNFNNCQVYIGGYSLAEALQRGRWREANQEIETPSPDIDPDGREHGLDRSPSPGNDERRELGAAALDDLIPYTSIPGSDGTALPSHAPSSRTSSISSTTDGGDDYYPSASAGRGQVITAEAEVYDEEGRPIPAARGRDLGPRGGDGGVGGIITPGGPADPIGRGDAVEPTPTITFPGDSDVVAKHRLTTPIRGFVPLPSILSESEDESSSLGSRYNSDSDDNFFSIRSSLTSPSLSLEDIAVLAMEAQNVRDLSDMAVTPAPEDLAAREIATPIIDGVPGQDGGVESRTPREPAAPSPEDLAGGSGRSTPIDRGDAVEPTPTVTFPEDSDVVAKRRLTTPIRGFVPLPSILSESEDESSSLGSRYNSDSDDNFFSIRSSLTSPSPSLEDIAVLAMEAQNVRDLGNDKAVTPSPEDLAARGSASGIATPIDGVLGQDGGAEGRTSRGPAASAPEDLAARDGASGRTTPIDGVPGQDGGIESRTQRGPVAASGIATPIDGVLGQDGGAEGRTSRGPAASAPEDLAARDGASGRTTPIDGVPGQDGGIESRTQRGPVAASGIATPIDGVLGQDGGAEGRTSRGPAASAPEDLAARDGASGRTTPIDGVPGQDGGIESRTQRGPVAASGIATPIDGVLGQDGGAEGRTSRGPAASAPEDLAARDGASGRTTPIDGVPGQDGGAEGRTSRGPAASAPEDLAARDGASGRTTPIDGVPGQDGGIESRTPRGPVAASGIATPIDGVLGQDGGAEGRIPREPAAPSPEDLAARGSASGRTTPIDGVLGQDGGAEGRTSRGPAALDRSILPIAPSSSTSRSPTVTQESVNLQRWHSMLRMGMHAGCQFAMNLGNENDIGAIAQKCAEKYSALAKREDLQDPATRRAALKKEMRDVLGEFGIPNIPLNHGKLTIKNGNVQGLKDTMHFSSPYGFGEKIDGMIQAALRDVNEVARRANLNCEIRPNILSLPRIALAVNNMKDPRKGLVLPSLGVNDDAPIPSRDAINFLEGVSNLAMLEEKPKIVKESSILRDDPEARKVSRLIRYFSALANEDEGATASIPPHGTMQQNMLSDGDIEALKATIEVLDAERMLVSQGQPMLHADMDAMPTEPVQESANSYDSIASTNRSDSISSTKSDTSSIESSDGASRSTSYKPHLAVSTVHSGATSVGDNTTHEVYTASVGAYYILSDERHTKTAESMLKMFSDSENDLPRCEMYSWAMLNKFSSIAGLSLAMHAKQPENVISAARYVFDSYKKAVDSKQSDRVIQEILEHRIPRALKRNYIDYVDLGDGTVNIENGAITGPTVDKVPAHFISPLGFGPYLDSVIIESAEDIAKIARRSTLNNSLSEMSRESLPALPVAVQQVTQDGGEYSRRFFSVPGDDSPIPQECGERILTHIGNICVAKGGTYNITPSDRQPERGVIIAGLAKDKIRAFNARADIDEQRESAIRQRQDANIARGASSTASMPARAPIPEPAPDSEAAMMDFYYATGARPKRRSTAAKSSISTTTHVVDAAVSRVAEEVKKCADGMKGVIAEDASSTIATPGHSPIVSQVPHQEGRSDR
ncbi:hypothetical protein [Anaplasma phagocytophilum]|uniref:hypothetical protein n=1 Tax=Anaplasma phagocytophilum TaxID=948 RepID=UPI00200FD0C0|nr:hypothetical protein [Anaplasma phagocytophilum]UQD54634.1 hypothetical protein ESP60_05020 [Anaplasma phagocytophilum]